MLAEGQLLAGRYLLDHPLAAGGMSDVWRATDQVLNRPVAVKVIRPGLLAQPGFAQRFAAEARILAGLRHPGIVGVYDYGEASGPDGPTAFLVMEFIDGEPLSERLARERRLSPAQTMAIVAQAAEALQTAHDAGVVHRDIKPANVLIRPDGAVVIVDFGVAKAQTSAGLTQTDTVLGTARYMAPEQVTNRSVTSTTDLYALGAVAYECLAGTPPFDADSPIALALKHVSEEPPPLPSTVPRRVRAIVARAMAKEPGERFPDAAAFASAARAASEPDPTAPLPAATAGAVRRSGRYVAAVGGAVVAVVVGVLLLASSLSSSEKPSVPAPSTSSQVDGNAPVRQASPGASLAGASARPAASRTGRPAASAPGQSPQPAPTMSEPAPATSEPGPASPSPQPETSTGGAILVTTPSPVGG